MSTTVAAWNIREGLAQPHEMQAIVEQIKSFDADVVVLSDAHSLDNDAHDAQPETLDNARQRLRAAGYALDEAEYTDTEPWHHLRNIMVLSRIAVARASVLRLSTRSAIDLTVQDPHTAEPLRIVGAHFDDRSEDMRIGHAFSFLGSLDADTPTVLAGDLNAVHANAPLASLLRSAAARIVADCLPTARSRSKAQRVVEACNGGTLELLEISGFHDADSGYKPTFPAKHPFLQLDHIMLSNELAVSDFYRATHRQASDHSAIVAKLHVS